MDGTMHPIVDHPHVAQTPSAGVPTNTTPKMGTDRSPRRRRLAGMLLAVLSISGVLGVTFPSPASAWIDTGATLKCYQGLAVVDAPSYSNESPGYTQIDWLTWNGSRWDVTPGPWKRNDSFYRPQFTLQHRSWVAAIVHHYEQDYYSQRWDQNRAAVTWDAQLSCRTF